MSARGVDLGGVGMWGLVRPGARAWRTPRGTWCHHPAPANDRLLPLFLAASAPPLPNRKTITTTSWYRRRITNKTCRAACQNRTPSPFGRTCRACCAPPMPPGASLSATTACKTMANTAAGANLMPPTLRMRPSTSPGTTAGSCSASSPTWSMRTSRSSSAVTVCSGGYNGARRGRCRLVLLPTPPPFAALASLPPPPHRSAPTLCRPQHVRRRQQHVQPGLAAVLPDVGRGRQGRPGSGVVGTGGGGEGGGPVRPGGTPGVAHTHHTPTSPYTTHSPRPCPTSTSTPRCGRHLSTKSTGARPTSCSAATTAS